MVLTWGRPLALVFAVTLCAAMAHTSMLAAAPESLFDGRTFGGWNGDTRNTWRVEDGAIVAGSPDEAAPRNEFLATDREFADFELRLQYKVDCTSGCNAGVQFRSRRVAGHHEVVGYQADIGPGITGALYDESRRNKMLAVPAKDLQEKALGHAKDGWVDYAIRAEGPRIRLWINGIEMLDYTEADESIPLTGMIALQIHGGLKGTIRYRDIRIEELGPRQRGGEGGGPAQLAQWGRPAQGVKVRLSCETGEVDVGSPLRLHVEVLNPGAAVVRLPGLKHHEPWRIQFLADDDTAYEWTYQATGIGAALEAAPGQKVAVDLPLMNPGIAGGFAGHPGLTELPPGRYRARVYCPFLEDDDKQSAQPLTLAGRESDPLAWIISNAIDLRVRGSVDAAEPGWTSVGDAAHQQACRQAAGPEQVFTGLLEQLPAPPRFSTLMRSHAYRLGDRKIAGRRVPALDALVGRQVEIRGKALDMSLEGQDIREIIPAAIRAAPGRRPAGSD